MTTIHTCSLLSAASIATNTVKQSFGSPEKRAITPSVPAIATVNMQLSIASQEILPLHWGALRLPTTGWVEKAFFAQVIAALSLSMFTERLSFKIESNSHSFIC
jgi:hypothetical protein